MKKDRQSSTTSTTNAVSWPNTSHIEAIAETEGVSIEQARRIRELEEELATTQQKLAQTLLECELLKKLQPHSPFANASSGYIETKHVLARLSGRAR